MPGLASLISALGGETTSRGIGAIGTLGNLALGAGRLGLDAAQFAARPRPLGMKTLLGHAGLIGGAGLVMAGARALGQNMALSRSYARMLQVYPELQHEDPQKVQLYFDTIAQSSPATASQPLVAGSLIKRLINFDGFDQSVFRDLVTAQGTLDKTRATFDSNAVNALHHGLGIAHSYLAR